MATIDSDLFLELFTIENMPACEVGMQLAEDFLAACGHAVEVLGHVDEQPAFLGKWRALIDHQRSCEDCLEV